MNRELFAALTSKEPLTLAEIDSKRKAIMGVGTDELDSEWFPMVEFEYNLMQFDKLKSVRELGMATSVVIIRIDITDVADSDKEDEALLAALAKQANYLSEIAQLIQQDDSLRFDAAGHCEYEDNQIQLEVAAPGTKKTPA